MVEFTGQMSFEFKGTDFNAEDVMQYLEEGYESGNCLLGKVYQDIKWTGKYDAFEMLKVKTKMVKEYFGM